MKNLETGLNYAQLNHVYSHGHQTDWFGAFIYCLKHGDRDAAHLIRFHNDPDYEEECREVAQVPTGSAPLLSCLEVSHDDEGEYLELTLNSEQRFQVASQKGKAG